MHSHNIRMSYILQYPHFFFKILSNFFMGQWTLIYFSYGYFFIRLFVFSKKYFCKCTFSKRPIFNVKIIKFNTSYKVLELFRIKLTSWRCNSLDSLIINWVYKFSFGRFLYLFAKCGTAHATISHQYYIIFNSIIIIDNYLN